MERLLHSGAHAHTLSLYFSLSHSACPREAMWDSSHHSSCNTCGSKRRGSALVPKCTWPRTCSSPCSLAVTRLPLCPGLYTWVAWKPIAYCSTLPLSLQRPSSRSWLVWCYNSALEQETQRGQCWETVACFLCKQASNSLWVWVTWYIYFFFLHSSFINISFDI